MLLALSGLFLSCKQSQRSETVSNLAEESTTKEKINIVTSESYGPAPDFTLEDLDGQLVQLSDYRGKIVVLHIATTWCPFCNAEAPHLEQLSKDYREKEVVVLIIDVKEPKELVLEKLKEHHQLTFPILLDTDGSVAASYAPEDVLPDLARDEVMLASNLLIDREGQIRFMSLLDSKNFDAELKELKEYLNELL